MRLSLLTVAREVTRWGISQTEAAALVTAALIDVGLVSRDNSTMIVDQYKIRREVEKVRRKATEGDRKRLMEDKLQALFFDGKKVKTLTVEEDGVFRQRRVKQEHIVLVGEFRRKIHWTRHTFRRSRRTIGS